MNLIKMPAALKQKQKSFFKLLFNVLSKQRVLQSHICVNNIVILIFHVRRLRFSVIPAEVSSIFPH